MQILVIQHKMIGDVLTTSLLFELLRDFYPKAQLHYLINENTLPVVQDNPFIDRIWLRSKSAKGRFLLSKEQMSKLESLKFDLIIDVYAKLGSASISALLKPKNSISYRKWYTQFKYNKTVKPLVNTSKEEGLAIVNRVLLLEKLGLVIERIPKPKIYLRSEELEQAKQTLLKAGIERAKPLFMIALLGSGPLKTYPLEQMAVVIKGLFEQSKDAQLLINYIPSQRPEVDVLLNQLDAQTRSRIFDKVYGKSLREFMALTAHCDALIGNEGGAVNIAKALEVPTFAIYTPWILKSAWNSYEATGQNASIHLQDIRPDLFKKHPKKYKKKALEYYKLLLPEQVLEKLQLFLKQNQL